MYHQTAPRRHTVTEPGAKSIPPYDMNRICTDATQKQKQKQKEWQQARSTAYTSLFAHYHIV